MWPDLSYKYEWLWPPLGADTGRRFVAAEWRAEFHCIGWPKLSSRSLQWIWLCCAFCLPRLYPLPLCSAHWHFQMWVVHKGYDWGERLTFCVSASAWQWLRSTDIYESVERSTPKIFVLWEREENYTLHIYICCGNLCSWMSDKKEIEKRWALGEAKYRKKGNRNGRERGVKEGW